MPSGRRALPAWVSSPSWSAEASSPWSTCGRAGVPPTPVSRPSGGWWPCARTSPAMPRAAPRKSPSTPSTSRVNTAPRRCSPRGTRPVTKPMARGSSIPPFSTPNPKMRLALLLLLIAAGPLAAQDAEKIPARMSWFPYLMGDATHGFLVIGHWQIARQAEYNQRAPFDWHVSAEAAWGSRGSRLATLKIRAPLLIEHWRFSADAGAVREGRFGYYGQGPGGDAGLEEAGTPSDFFRVHRTRFYGRAEVTRRIVGPLHASVAAGLTRFSFRSVEADGLFAMDYPGGEETGTDATGRLTLVLDTRNNELIPANGLLLEAGVHGGTG